jgi:hypothetical protein
MGAYLFTVGYVGGRDGETAAIGATMVTGAYLLLRARS